MNIVWWKRLYRLLRLEFPYWTLFKDHVFTAGSIISGRDYPECLMTELSALLVDNTEIEWGQIEDHDKEFVNFVKQIYSQDNEDIATSIYKMNESLPLARMIKNDDGKAYCLRRFRYESDSYIIAGAAARFEEPNVGDIHWRSWLGEIEKAQHELSRSMLLMALYDRLPENVPHEDKVGLIEMIPHERRRSFTALKELYRLRSRLSLCPESFSRFFAFVVHPADKKAALELEYITLAGIKQFDKAFASFSKSLETKDLYDFENFILQLLDNCETELLIKMLPPYIEKLESENDICHKDYLSEIVDKLEKQGLEYYAKRIHQIIATSQREQPSTQWSDLFF